MKIIIFHQDGVSCLEKGPWGTPRLVSHVDEQSTSMRVLIPLDLFAPEFASGKKLYEIEGYVENSSMHIEKHEMRTDVQLYPQNSTLYESLTWVRRQSFKGSLFSRESSLHSDVQTKLQAPQGVSITRGFSFPCVLKDKQAVFFIYDSAMDGGVYCAAYTNKDIAKEVMKYIRAGMPRIVEKYYSTTTGEFLDEIPD
ncbi:MAG: hypothetical protein ACI83D_000163 [Planctomycetota bacterium]|jgi:hypothetical protein